MVRRASPVRTCVGCRRRVPANELLRVVADVREDDLVVLVADPARRKPGRGAHLHPDPACLALAERRRAFGRALRLAGVVDSGPLAGAIRDPRTQRQVAAHSRHPDSKVGRPT